MDVNMEEELLLLTLTNTILHENLKNISFEKMPNFSNEIQTNNVLTRRILALKVKDGLHHNMDEAES